MKEISIIDMFNAKIHFGHLKKIVSPKMSSYIYTISNKISIINLDLTLKKFVAALNFIENIIKKNGTILFIGTKKQASDLIKDYAEKVSMPYINFRWLGGLLTNYKTIRLSIDKLNELDNNVNKIETHGLKKKEILLKNRKLLKLKSNFYGIRNLKNLPDAIFVIDVGYESISISEANKLSIPIVGVVDTNTDPSNIDYIIPGNDDSSDSIKFYLEHVCSVIINVKNQNKVKL